MVVVKSRHAGAFAPRDVLESAPRGRSAAEGAEVARRLSEMAAGMDPIVVQEVYMLAGLHSGGSGTTWGTTAPPASSFWLAPPSTLGLRCRAVGVLVSRVTVKHQWASCGCGECTNFGIQPESVECQQRGFGGTQSGLRTARCRASCRPWVTSTSVELRPEAATGRRGVGPHQRRGLNVLVHVDDNDPPHFASSFGRSYRIERILCACWLEHVRVDSQGGYPGRPAGVAPPGHQRSRSGGGPHGDPWHAAGYEEAA